MVHLIARLNDGGPARVVARLAAASMAAGDRCTVLTGSCADDEVDIRDQVAATGATVEAVPGLGRTPGWRADLAALRWLARRVAQLQPDVLHTHTAKAGTLGRLIATWQRRACLHSYHGHVLRGYFRPGIAAVIRLWERLLAGSHHHHALTASQVHDLRDAAGIGRPSRWHQLPVPVPAVRPQTAAWHADLPSGVPRVGFIGRFAPVKDLPLWLTMLGHAQRQQPIHGVVCGHGDMLATDQARALAYSMNLSVTWAGQVPTGEALAACDVVVMTSRNEGFPLVAVEAASAGVPVIAPPVGGLADLTEMGLVLSARRDAKALAARVTTLVNDTAAMAAQRQRALAAARICAPDQCLPRYLASYRRIASQV